MQPIRVALTGSTVSEPVNELLAVVGRERSLARHARGGRARRRRCEPPRDGPRRAGRSLLGARGLRQGATASAAAAGPARDSAPTTGARAARRSRSSQPPPPRTVYAPVRLAFVGDINLGTRRFPTACRPTAAAACSIGARPRLTGDLVVGNFEGVLADTRHDVQVRARGRRVHARRHRRRRSRAPPEADEADTRRPPRPRCATPSCTPTTLAPRLVEAGFTHLNLANNHANDFGPAARGIDRADPRRARAPALRAAGAASRSTRVRRGDSLTTVGLVGSPPIPTPTTCSTSRAARRWWTRSGRWSICWW